MERLRGLYLFDQNGILQKMAGNYMTAAGIMQEQPEDYTQVSIESVE